MRTEHRDLIQGSEEWHAARCGVITASEVKLIVSPTGKVADNDKTRAHVYELCAQRITRYVEPFYVSDDMLRGHEDEIRARALYSEKYEPARSDIGFITNSKWGFTLGYSPDGTVGEHGLIECKSRRQKYQIQTIAEQAVPAEYMLQLQTGLLVSERQWIDFISYCGGLPMVVIRVYPDPKTQSAILDAAAAFEAKVAEKTSAFHQAVAANGWHPTQRHVEKEMFLSE